MISPYCGTVAETCQRAGQLTARFGGLSRAQSKFLCPASAPPRQGCFDPTTGRGRTMERRNRRTTPFNTCGYRGQTHRYEFVCSSSESASPRPIRDAPPSLELGVVEQKVAGARSGCWRRLPRFACRHTRSGVRFKLAARCVCDDHQSYANRRVGRARVPALEWVWRYNNRRPQESLGYQLLPRGVGAAPTSHLTLQ